MRTKPSASASAGLPSRNAAATTCAPASMVRTCSEREVLASASVIRSYADMLTRPLRSHMGSVFATAYRLNVFLGAAPVSASGPVRPLWREGVVDLDQNDEPDPERRAEKPSQGADCIERLRAHDAAANRLGGGAGRFLVRQAGPFRVRPCEVEARPGKQNVGVVDEEGGAIVEKTGEQAGRKGKRGDDSEKQEMQPGEVAVHADKVRKLRLLPEPEDAERGEAHEPGRRGRRDLDERRQEFTFGVNIGGLGGVDVEDEQRHGDGEDAVAQRRDAPELRPGDGVVVGRHDGGARPVRPRALWPASCRTGA